MLIVDVNIIALNVFNMLKGAVKAYGSANQKRKITQWWVLALDIHVIQKDYTNIKVIVLQSVLMVDKAWAKVE